MQASSNLSPAPSGRDHSVTPPRPVVLYQGDDATVTTVYFDVAGLRYPVTELDRVERVESAGGLRHPRWFELWAWFRGERVRLFRSSDARVFGQVCRALTRARERAGLT
jgi:hypothetical protein